MPIKHTAQLLTLLTLLTSPWAQAEDNLPSSVWGLTAEQILFNVDSANPSVIKSSTRLSGLEEGDQLVGIDYRVAYGDLYGLAQSGQIYLINPRTGAAVMVKGSKPIIYMRGRHFGFDFNPAADKMRVVGDGDLNLRIHPENGSLIDFDRQTSGIQIDPKLSFDKQEPHFGDKPDIVAAGYTYNTQDAKLTTNYAIDRRLDALMMQGTKEGVSPGVSPNLGVLYSVGKLGQGNVVDANLDISDVHNVALATLQIAGRDLTELYQVNLNTGAATSLGRFGTGQAVIGLAIEP